MYFICVEIVGLFKYLKPTIPINVLGKLFKNILFFTQSKYIDDLLHFKSVSVQKKKRLHFKVYSYMLQINCWSYCRKYMGSPTSCVHGT